MFDIKNIDLSGCERALARIADALERLSPPPLGDSPRRVKKHELEDLLTTTDDRMADIEDEDNRQRSIIEGE